MCADLQSGKAVGLSRQRHTNSLYDLLVCGYAIGVKTNYHTMLGQSTKGHAIFSTPEAVTYAALTLPTMPTTAPSCGLKDRPPQHVDSLPPVVVSRPARDLRGA